MENFSEKVNFIWSIAELLRDSYKRSKYQDVILPFTVLKRIDCVLAPTKETVLEVNAKFKGKLDNPGPQLCKASGFAFYNTSIYDFEKLCGDPQNLAANLRSYIACFSDNMREVLEKYDFDNNIAKLNEAGILFQVMEKFKNIDLHPDKVNNIEMGYIFEELIRRFNEAMNENPGEHFTPREVIRLMVNLSFAEDKDTLSHNHVIRTVYDPCCGSGGMLTIAKERMLEMNPNADVHLFGQEVNPETYALCKSDLYMKSKDGRDADNIAYGSTLGDDKHADKRFDYLLANPPYGKEWKIDQAKVQAEFERGTTGRFSAGLPRISDGQLLFLQHMLSRMKDPKEGGSRVAIVMNGSPLFTGDAGSGESEIRRWILENDWLEAIIALPEQLFYNTSIATYVWMLTNHKDEKRKGKVQLINATDFWVPMRKSLGNKRREISWVDIVKITDMFMGFQESEYCKIFDSADFGYRKITVERPLRLNFRVNPERIARLKEDKAFQNLVASKKKGEKEKVAEIETGKKTQERILAAISTIGDTLYKDRPSFEKAIDQAIKANGISAPASLKKTIVYALSERDETAEICKDKEGKPEADSELRDTENVSLIEDIQAYFDREVKPHVPDAWIDTVKCDDKDGNVGIVGYEINFNRYFYKYVPPRPLENIETDLRKVEKEILEMLKEVIP